MRLNGFRVHERKFIILDLQETTPEQMLGLAAVTLALGITY